MAEFHFLDDAFIGRLGAIVGSSMYGKLYIKRFKAPSNPKSDAQLEVRGLFAKLKDIGEEIKGALFFLNRPKVSKGRVVAHFVHLNKKMFSPSSRHQRDPGQWTRWNPEHLELCSGTLPPLRLSSAELSDSAVGGGVKDVTVKWTLDGIPYAQTTWKVCLFIYDEDCGEAIHRELALCNVWNNPSTGMSEMEPNHVIIPLTAFANMSSYNNIHVYAVYLNGATGADPATNREAIAKAVSRTSYIRAAFAQPPNPAPNPTPKAGENGAGSGERNTAESAALLLEESRRLAAEAQRLADEAKAVEAKT
jgi:hypothetical protein